MKERLDILLVERRLVESRTKAQWLIKQGYVSINGEVITKPGKKVENEKELSLLKEFPYVGRGGLKLEAALESFLINPEAKTCADLGASIGGFTDCLLKHGAKKIYVVDTATELLHPSLRCKSEQVVLYLGVDARMLKSLPERVDIITIDLTFASIKDILPNVKSYLKKNGDIIVLIKPFFETNFYDNNKIIQDSENLQQILLEVMNWCSKNSFFPKGIIKSPILGKGGSLEFLVHFKIGRNNNFDYKERIKSLLY